MFQKLWKTIQTLLSKKLSTTSSQTRGMMTQPIPPSNSHSEDSTPMTDKQRKIGPLGKRLIQKYEGLKLEAYPDPGTGGDPWTIGYGHTGPEVKKGLKITSQQADELLAKDLEKFEKGVCRLVSPNVLIDLSQNQFDALVCFSYNVGLTNLEKSTLLERVNERRFEEASKEFEKWTKAAGKVLPGLIKRRIAERDLFLSK